tara:strand:+ start:2437 stop:2973 length:537 start_codon:yes stop_codon:yes gene_type:complete
VGLFLEIRIRQNGEEKWVDASDFLNYMLKEHLIEESSKGGVLPYPDEDNKEEIFNLWWDLYDKKRSKIKTRKYWFKNIKSTIISDIMKHTKVYVEGTEKQYRKDPHSYLLNECWEDEIILDPETIQKQKAEQIEEEREKAYKKQLEEQKKIDDDAADDEWKRDFFSGLKKNLKNKGVE